MKKYIFFFFSILSQPILTSGQMVFASSGFYSEEDKENINSIWSHLLAKTFNQQFQNDPELLFTSEAVYCGGNPAIQPLLLEYPYCSAVDKKWMTSVSNGEVELLMKWDSHLDTCFVNSFSAICNNQPFEVKDPLGRPFSSEHLGNGFGPPTRIPFTSAFIKLISEDKANKWTKYLQDTFRRNYGTRFSDISDTIEICHLIDTSYFIYLKPKQLFSILDDLALNKGAIDIYKDSVCTKPYSFNAVDSILNPIIIRYRQNLDDSMMIPVESVDPMSEATISVGYQTHLQKKDMAVLREGPDHFFLFIPKYLKFNFRNGSYFFANFEQFMNALNEWGYDATLFESAFKFSLLSHFKINQYWDGTQLD